MKEQSYINKWAVVLGGSSGLGLATAKKLAQEGMHLCIVHRSRRSALEKFETAMDDLTPPAAVKDLKIDQVGKDWVQVSWTATGDDEQTGVAAAYVLRYGGNLRVVNSWSAAMDVQQLPVP